MLKMIKIFSSVQWRENDFRTGGRGSGRKCKI